MRQTYNDFARSLGIALEFLRHRSALAAVSDGRLDLIRVESLAQLDDGSRLRILKSMLSYYVVVASELPQ